MPPHISGHPDIPPVKSMKSEFALTNGAEAGPGREIYNLA